MMFDTISEIKKDAVGSSRKDDFIVWVTEDPHFGWGNEGDDRELHIVSTGKVIEGFRIYHLDSVSGFLSYGSAMDAMQAWTTSFGWNIMREMSEAK